MYGINKEGEIEDPIKIHIKLLYFHLSHRPLQWPYQKNWRKF